MSLKRVRGSKLIALILISAIANGVAEARQTHDARVIDPPTPKYPMLASWLQLEGRCEVRFAIDEDGLAFAVQPACTRPIFCFEAKRAVTAVRFEPKRVDGIPMVRTNIIYPLTWAFHESYYDPGLDPTPLKPCEELSVS